MTSALLTRQTIFAVFNWGKNLEGLLANQSGRINPRATHREKYSKEAPWMGRPGTILTEQEIRNLIEDYSNGMLQKDVLKKYHIGRNKLNAILKSFNIEKRNKITQEQEQKVIYNYLTLKQGLISAGKEFHFSQKTVKQLLLKNGVMIRNYQESKQAARKYSVDDDFFKKQNSEMAYFLGFLAADGCVSKKENLITLHLHERDEEILKTFQSLTKNTRQLKYFKNNSDVPTVKFSVWSKEWKQDLAHYGIIPQKTFKLEPPKFLNKELLKDFIRGYFDGDGSIYYITETQPIVKITGASKVFINWLKEILINQYGIQCSIYESKTTDDVTMYNLQISRQKEVEKFFHLLYDDAETYLRRKYEKFLTYYNSPRDPISFG